MDIRTIQAEQADEVMNNLRSKETVKPLFVTSAVRPWGAEHSMSSIIQGLSGLGVRSTVLCSSPAVAEFIRSTTSADVLVITTPNNRYLRLAAFARTILLRGRQASTIVVFSVNLYFLAAAFRLLPFWPVKFIADVHDSFETPEALRRVRMSLRGFHRIIFISDYVRAMLSASGDSRLVPRPIASYEGNHTLQASSLLTVGIAGRLDPEKRIELAIKAVASTSPLVKLSIFGESFSDNGEYRDYLVRLGNQLLPSRVDFKGAVPFTEVYNEIDILFVANSREASGRTVGEAMAAGIPVIVPSEGGAQEFIEHNISGLIYEADNVTAASTAISSLANSAELRSAVGKEGLKKVTTERSVDHVAAKYLDAISGW